MKFDVILMNPPYSQTLHEKFFLKSFSLSSDNGFIVSVEPATWLFSKRKNKELCSKIEQYYSEIESINGVQYFDADIQVQMTINFINKASSKKLIFNNKEYQSSDDIFIFSTNDSLRVFYDSIKQDANKDNLNNHLNRSWKDKEVPSSDSYIVRIPAIRGHMDSTREDGKMEDFYTIISNDDEELFKTIGKASELYNKEINGQRIVKLYFNVNSLKEAKGLFNYFKTDFCRACLFLNKKNLHLDSGELKYIPWENFNDDIFQKEIYLIDSYLFSKYKIPEDIIKEIRKLIPDYYNIRQV